jgi:hypothetical protein
LLWALWIEVWNVIVEIVEDEIKWCEMCWNIEGVHYCNTAVSDVLLKTFMNTDGNFPRSIVLYILAIFFGNFILVYKLCSRTIYTYS